jgi:hypothetical protein
MLERLFTSIQNIFKIPELRSRILFTITLLAVYRVGGHIPTPGINGEALSRFLNQNVGALQVDYFCLGDHALHFGLDHSTAFDGCRSTFGQAGEGGRAGAKEDRSIYAIFYRLYQPHTVLWNRLGP